MGDGGFGVADDMHGVTACLQERAQGFRIVRVVLDDQDAQIGG